MTASQQTVSFIQLPTPAIGPQENCGNLPMAAANLLRHAQQEPGGSDINPVLPNQEFLNRAGDAALLRWCRDVNPTILCLSLMVWNCERSLYLAKRLYDQAPGPHIWLGGPEIAPDSSVIKDPDSPFDIAVEGEGESAFAMLTRLQEPGQITGLLKPGGARTQGSHRIPLLMNLASIHDPFINGVVLMENNRTVYAELWRGCKYRCAFCCYHQGRKNQATARPLSNVSELLRWAREHEAHCIYILDPSLEQRSDLAALLTCLTRHNRNPVIPIFAELRAEAVDYDLAARLYHAGIRSVEVGLQTMSAQALGLMGRHLETQLFLRGVTALRAHEIQVKIDLMLGLPGDSPEQFEQTLLFLAEQALTDRYQIFRTQVLPGTRLRRQAAKWGVVYDARPPYFVRSTPEWPCESIAAMLYRCSEVLDVNLEPDASPFLRKPDWAAVSRAEFPYPGTTVCFQKSFNLDQLDAQQALLRERFEDLGNYCVLWLKCSDPMNQLNQLQASWRNAITANPFSTLVLALESATEFPLDVLDLLQAVSNNLPESRYLAEIAYQRPVAYTPQRRILVLLELQADATFPEAWLADVREVAEIVWLADGSQADRALGRWLERAGSQDYVYLHLAIADACRLPSLVARVATQAPYPEQILFPALAPQWFYQQSLTGDSDW